LQYLDDFGKQISIRKTNNSSLEEQLSSLSKAYNQAQEKLLQTETALMAETVLVEKQRSIIDVTCLKIRFTSMFLKKIWKKTEYCLLYSISKQMKPGIKFSKSSKN